MPAMQDAPGLAGAGSVGLAAGGLEGLWQSCPGLGPPVLQGHLVAGLLRPSPSNAARTGRQVHGYSAPGGWPYPLS